MNDHTLILLSDDIRNTVGALLSVLAPSIAQHLPVPPPATPETVNIFGGGSSGGLKSVVVHASQTWRAACRVVVNGSGLITVEVQTPRGYAECWRSDTPMRVGLQPEQRTTP
jgi:hypothetical protein